MKIKAYSRNDEQQILQLFEEVFGRDLGLEFWRWRYIDNPFGKGIIYLMLDENKLVGHYAVTPIQLQIFDDYITAALSMTTMTHPDYRGRGIFPELARCAYRQCEEYGIELVFGFPNEMIFKARVKKLGWIGFGKVKAWRYDEIRRTMARKLPYNIEEIFSFDSRFDRLWEIAKPACGFVVPRKSEFLNWRYFQKPGNEYHVVAINDLSGNTKGYAVYKIFQDGLETKGHIIDFLFVNEPGAAETVVDYGLHYLSKANVDSISCWVPDVCGMREIMLRRGFKKIEWPCYFGLKYLGTYCEERPVLQYKDLYLTMGDSDVF